MSKPLSWFIVLTSIYMSIYTSACESAKDLSRGAEDAYLQAKESYDERDFQEAIDDLQEFRSRYPYSRFATTAELLIANSHFELSEYPQAASAYQQFTILHPDHPKLDFAFYRTGLSYWEEAPDNEDREQDFTKKALNIWRQLKKQFPNSSYIEMMQEDFATGEQRVVDSEIFVAKFYCKQERWLTCFFLMDQLVHKHSFKHPDSIKDAIRHAASLAQSAQEAADNGEFAFDEHLLTRNLSKTQQSSFFANKIQEWKTFLASVNTPKP